MRRNLSYRGGAQRGAGPAATNPQPAGFVATESMQLLRYSLFTAHRYELNMSSTSNSFSPFCCISSGQTGGCINYSAPTSTGTCRRKKLGYVFFPHSQSVASLHQLLLLLLLLGISYATVRSTYGPASGPFHTCRQRAILL